MGKAQYLPDSNILKRLVKAGKIREKVHPNYAGLAIYKYRGGFNFFTDEDAHWVQWCRGLVYDHNADQVVCCPMPKFHNHYRYSRDMLEDLTADNNYSVSRKIDGSCVLVWYYDEKWHTSTLFSFDSEQAKAAERLLGTLHDMNKVLKKNRTHIFEVVYPQNRIILNYGDEESMTYLASFDPSTGEEHRIEPLDTGGDTFHVAGTQQISLDELFAFTKEATDTEGYVLSAPSTSDAMKQTRIKFKTKWYFNHSRFLLRVERDGLVKACLWHHLSEEMDPIRIDDLDHRIHHIENAVYYLYDHIVRMVPVLRDLSSRKEQAGIITSLDTHPCIKSALFCEMDQKYERARTNVWKALEDTDETSILCTAQQYARTLDALSKDQTPQPLSMER